jgi:hypothetical protein
MPITHPEITVDAKNQLPHGTVRRAPEGFAHAILLDQMGNEAKWQTVDLYGSMETYTDAEVADWPIVYMPAPDEVWRAVNRQVCEPVDLASEQEFSSADPPEEGRVYPIPVFVIPCKNCDHKKWIHDNETGECHGRVYLPGAMCDCTGFEDVPEPDVMPDSVSRPEKWVGETEPPVPLFACLCGHRLHEHVETDPPFCKIRGCPCVGFKEDS